MKIYNTDTYRAGTSIRFIKKSDIFWYLKTTFLSKFARWIAENTHFHQKLDMMSFC